ncbi:hypothetical protein Q7P37_000623 [Cladosporium fusiforme]
MSDASKIISETAKQEEGPAQGSTSAQMQSEIGKTRNFEQAAQEVGQKMQGAPETVTSEDAAYLKSREARAIGQGQPPSDSIASDAERLASRNEGATKDAQSTGPPDPVSQSAADRAANFEKEAENIVTKMATNPQSVTKEEADLAHSREHRAFGQTSKGGVAAQAQSLANDNMKDPAATQSDADRVGNFDQVADQVTDKMANAPETITKEDGDVAHSREQRAFGATHQGGLASQTQSQAAKNESN